VGLANISNTELMSAGDLLHLVNQKVDALSSVANARTVSSSTDYAQKHLSKSEQTRSKRKLKISGVLSERTAQFVGKQGLYNFILQGRMCAQSFEQSLPYILDEKSNPKAFDAINAAMHKQLGAVEVLKPSVGQNRKRDQKGMTNRTVYFLELDEESKSIYLCRSSCRKAQAVDSWISERCASFSYHAFERVIQRTELWNVHDEHRAVAVTRALMVVLSAYERHQQSYGLKALRLFSTGWHLDLKFKGTCFIIGRDSNGLTRVATAYTACASARTTADQHTVRLQMIAPKRDAKKLPLLRLTTTFGGLGLFASDYPNVSTDNKKSVGKALTNCAQLSA